MFLADFLADVPANLQKLAIFGRRSYKETNYLFQNIYLFYKVCQKYTRFANVLAHLPKRLPKTQDFASQFGTSAAEIAYVFRACAGKTD